MACTHWFSLFLSLTHHTCHRFSRPHRWSPCCELLPHSCVLWFQLCQAVLWLTSGLLPEGPVHHRLVPLRRDVGVRLQSLSPSHCRLCFEHIRWYQGTCLLLDECTVRRITAFFFNLITLILHNHHDSLMFNTYLL